MPQLSGLLGRKDKEERKARAIEKREAKKAKQIENEEWTRRIAQREHDERKELTSRKNIEGGFPDDGYDHEYDGDMGFIEYWHYRITGINWEGSAGSGHDGIHPTWNWSQMKARQVADYERRQREKKAAKEAAKEAAGEAAREGTGQAEQKQPKRKMKDLLPKRDYPNAPTHAPVNKTMSDGPGDQKLDIAPPDYEQTFGTPSSEGTKDDFYDAPTTSMQSRKSDERLESMEEALAHGPRKDEAMEHARRG